MKKRTDLAWLGISKLLSGFLLMGPLLFLPAGTWDYPGAWRLLVLLFGSMLVLGCVLFFVSPKILERRLAPKEKEKTQGIIILFSALMFVASFLLSAFDFRYGWTSVPSWLVILGCVVFFVTYFGFAELLRENEFLSRIVEVQEDQKVISTGFYGIVRHPMYFLITFMFFSMPIILGSFAGLLPLLGLPVLLVKRIQNEEKVLEDGLAGYKEYKMKVRYRMIPFIW